MASPIRTDGLNTRIPWSLRGYDEADLHKLDISLLRKLCYERQLLSTPTARRKTCVTSLIEWKNSRQNASTPLTFSLMDEGDNLQRLLECTHISELRNLCRERDLNIMGDPLYHKQHCIDLLLSHQRRSIDLSKREQDRIANIEVKTPFARSPVLLRPRIQEEAISNDNLSPIERFTKGDVLQLRVAGRWHKCTIMHVGRNGICSVLWAHDESIDQIDLSHTSDKSMRFVN